MIKWLLAYARMSGDWGRFTHINAHIKWNEKWSMWEVNIGGDSFKFVSSVYKDVFFWVKYQHEIDEDFAIDYFKDVYGDTWNLS